MKSLQFSLAFLLLCGGTLAQDYHDQIQSRLAEIDEAEVSYKINDLSKKISSELRIRQLSSVGILPFRDANNKRTGLTEFIAAELAKKLILTKNLQILKADQIDNAFKKEFDLAKIRWPQDCSGIAAQLNLASLIQGLTIDNQDEIIVRVEIFAAKTNRIVNTLETSLPRTASLSRLVNLDVNETPQATPDEIPPAVQEPPPPAEKPKDKPIPSPVSPTYTMQTGVEIAVRKLADKLAAHFQEEKQNTVGVLEFLDLQGRISHLGKFISEELTTAFFEKGKFTMVERGLLQQVMREHALTQSGIIDVTQAQEIGKAVGADAVITGSLSDIGNEIKVNARLIDVQKGTLLAVAGESISKTENVSKMYNNILWVPSGTITPQPQPTTTKTAMAPAGYVFLEDFKNVQEGMLPAGWLGGEKLMVKSEGRQKFLTDFESQRSHKVLIDNVTFPENFEFTTVFKFSHQASNTRLIAYLGSLTMTIDVYGWYQLNNTKVNKKVDWRNKLVKAVLTKEALIFKLFINGEEVLLMRDADFKLPQAISLEFQNMSGFKLMQVDLKES